MTLLLAFLAFGTIGAVSLFAYYSAQESHQRFKDSGAPKSTLASDTPDTFEGTPPDLNPLLDLIPTGWRGKSTSRLAYDAGESASRFAHGAGETASRLAHDAGETASRLAHEAGVKASNLAHDAEEAASNAKEKVSKTEW